MLLIFAFLFFAASHEVLFHEIVQVAVQNSLGVRGLMSCTQVFDHFIRMQHITPDL